MIPGDLEQLKQLGDAPLWMTEESLKTLQGGYLLQGETPRMMYTRLARASAKALKQEDTLTEKFFNIMWDNWLCPASPVCSNLGTERGLPISCFGLHVGDSVDEIMSSMYEVAMLSKHGGGLGTYWGDVRGRNSPIAGNGRSDGIIPFNKIYDSTILGISQGGTRRGAGVSYLPIEHPDADEFLEMRRPSGDINRQCLNIHHAVCISDNFMEKVVAGDEEARAKWTKLLKCRFETGEPYFFFSDTVSRHRPECYKNLGLDVKSSQLCNEIYLHMDGDHTFVCCLSSMNLTKWDEWKNTDAVQTAIWFLDGVMEEFIQKTEGKSGFERARRFAIKSRALGLGVLGFHSLLQKKGLLFDSFETYLLNNQIFKRIRDEADKATLELGLKYGEVEWTKGTGRRNTHCIAVAPTVSNSIISGNVSAGIEPFAANAYAQKTAKGTFLQRNKELEALLESLEKNTEQVWSSIVNNEGSVAHLGFLTQEQKQLFATAREINQFAVVKLAAARQKWIDQGQSLNLFFPANTDPKYYNQVHLEAWKAGLLGLYYCRTGSALKGDSGSREYKRESTECKMCEG
jgi:ribonucleoside-diphosphate reductase alpha chain